jgi:branched-chain amino acid transport system permease protein
MISPEVISLLGGAIFVFSLYLTLATAANLQYGFTGLPNFGLVLYPMISSYLTVGLATLMLEILSKNPIVLPPDTTTLTYVGFYSIEHPIITVIVSIISIIIASLITSIIGFATSLPALRLKADYLGISLLAVTESVRVIINNTDLFFGGVYGFRVPMNPIISLGITGERSYIAYGLLGLFIAVISILVSRRITNTPYGRVLKMIRDDEELAKIFGKDTKKYKSQVMAIGAFFAGLIGGLDAFYLQYVSAFTFPITYTFEAIFIVIIGGMSSYRGMILMTLIYVSLGYFILPYIQTNFSSSLQGIPIDYFRYIAFSILLILILIYKPKGIIPEKPIETEGLKEVKKNENNS